MGKQRFFIALAALCLSVNVIAKSSDNPFAKTATVNIGSGGAGWRINSENKTATLSGADSGVYYHLFYDRKQLRLRLSETAQDNDGSGKTHDQFSVYDVTVDGARLPVFAWCLNNQDRHSRFLQQGLQVAQGVCANRGEVGTFIMKLNVDSLNALKKGRSLTYELKPYRTKVDVTFDISGFSDMVAKLNVKPKPVVVEPEPAAAPKPAPVVAAPKPEPVKKCKVSAPKELTKIKAAEYDCDDAAAKAKAQARIDAAVKRERERQKKLAAEAEKKRLAAEAAKKAEADRIAAEKAALAASQAQQKAIVDDIARKMIAVCKKKWANGEHRCYCQKYIDQAPADIQEKSKEQCG